MYQRRSSDGLSQEITPISCAEIGSNLLEFTKIYVVLGVIICKGK